MREILSCALAIILLLSIACGHGPEDARKELAAMDVEYTTERFFEAVRNGDLVVTKLFLDSGMDPNTRERAVFERTNVPDATALAVAAWHGNEKQVELLLEHGAAVNTVMGSGRIDALTVAAARPNVSVVQTLLNAGPDRPSKERALAVATDLGHTEIQDLLLASGAAGEGEAAAVRFRCTERQRRTMADLRSIGTAIEEYSIDQNVYPEATTIDELVPLISPDYIRKCPMVDGWGNPFSVGSTKSTYTLRSHGADGVADTGSGGPQASCDADIIFKNGTFAQWPEQTQR